VGFPVTAVEGAERRVRTPAIQAQGAAVAFGDRVLWDRVDLVIEPGTFTAILGPNGVGKSTFLKVVLGLRRLSAGWVEVLGAPAGRERRRLGLGDLLREAEGRQEMDAAGRGQPRHGGRLG